MSYESAECPVCRREARRGTVPGAHKAHCYDCPSCGRYYLWDPDRIRFLNSDTEFGDDQPHHLRALLQERRLKKYPTPVLQFSTETYRDLPESVPMRVSDLLAEWPRTVAERIERALCNVARVSKSPGQTISIGCEGGDVYLLFAYDPQQQRFFIHAMLAYDWISIEGTTSGSWSLRLTPAGWALFDELTRGKGNASNPAFVAMWFGGKNRTDEMTQLFYQALKPAIQDAGYIAKRADTDEHNEPIMDRIISDIRIAPFLVAELTENNPGVYYEAGLASGHGTTVIYCSQEGQKVHFDVTGVSQVRWRDLSDLRGRLRDRIRGSIGEGPHSITDDEGAAVHAG